MTELGLNIENLSIAFDRGRKEAISGLDLKVLPSQALGLVGESGSGKSLASRAALGLLPRKARVTGRITLDGQSVLELSPAQLRRIRGSGIAMIFQDPMSSLNPVVRVGEAIAQVIRSHESVAQGVALERAVALMARVGIRDPETRMRSFPHEFSGGMRQRIMIAMALAARPRMLLADEPTTALDVIVQDGILKLLDQLRRDEGMGLLLVSHDLAVVGSVCDRIAVMYAGQIVEEGPAMDVLMRSRMPYTVGLHASTQRSKTLKRLPSIPGAPPPLGERPASCRFAARCPLVAPQCLAGPVPLVSVGSDHMARCVRTAEVANLDRATFTVREREAAHNG
ncbi:MAG: Oligopeptide transport ATP-binding protein OppD [Devosia sp.]|uniref:ABC transporter ATP-binding protein n=1 Tax=Devosia sp. TaxID=1871048 RepID=UPI00261DD050|nr:ABC transporter ATP-binding protein [Devosia sp.]MDB5542017.1 Oligopeptide transport ATP-binding protein OppD [Devosia sp.]